MHVSGLSTNDSNLNYLFSILSMTFSYANYFVKQMSETSLTQVTFARDGYMHKYTININAFTQEKK